MVLHFCTGEKQAFQEELRKFTTCNVRIVSVRAVRRLHNAGTFRPRPVICDITRGAEHGEFFEIVVFSQEKAIAIIYACAN